MRISNCDVTNCVGTPADRANVGAFVDTGPFRVGANVNYRASIENKNFKDDPAGCASTFADRQAPFDPLTYGQQSFDPLDYAGAMGRFSTVGLKYRFFWRSAPFACQPQRLATPRRRRA